MPYGTKGLITVFILSVRWVHEGDIMPSSFIPQTTFCNHHRHSQNSPFRVIVFLKDSARLHPVFTSGHSATVILIELVVSLAPNPQRGGPDLCIYVPQWTSNTSNCKLSHCTRLWPSFIHLPSSQSMWYRRNISWGFRRFLWKNKDYVLSNVTSSSCLPSHMASHSRKPWTYNLFHELRCGHIPSNVYTKILYELLVSHIPAHRTLLEIWNMYVWYASDGTWCQHRDVASKALLQTVYSLIKHVHAQIFCSAACLEDCMSTLSSCALSSE
jgi:hypothetical protein